LKRISWRLIAIVAALVTAVVYLLPTLHPGLWPHKRINLGLDLQGGMHLLFRVDREKAVEAAVERNADEVRDALRQARVRYQRIEVAEGRHIEVQLAGQEASDGFQTVLDKEFVGLRIVSDQRADDLRTVVLTLPDKEIEHIQTLSVAQALETIRNRIDQFGVSEPDIRRQADDQILLQLPGVKEQKRAKELIGRTALLEFKLVDELNDLGAALEGNVPAGSEVLYEVARDPSTNRTIKTPYLIKKRALLTGGYLTDARVQIDSQYNEPYVSIDFDKKGGQIFERVTAENVKKRLAIVLDGKVYSAPVIQEKISGGQARITGSFTTEEARDLAIVLRSGALPAPLILEEERSVGPSLGSESIRSGMISMIIGGVLVIVFMVLYYRAAGLIADCSLLFNMLLIAAGLAAFQATLTLPGIAGIILTIGMAVDANVLIYERIREELAVGKSVRAAVDAGYDRASLAIIDSNLTTLIAALVLFQFGTGPVKGFAVTLSLGVVASMFAALVFTREVFEQMLIGRKITRLSI
jgi:preprotein translocase subunit SecD